MAAVIHPGGRKQRRRRVAQGLWKTDRSRAPSDGRANFPHMSRNNGRFLPLPPQRQRPIQRSPRRRYPSTSLSLSLRHHPLSLVREPTHHAAGSACDIGRSSGNHAQSVINPRSSSKALIVGARGCYAPLAACLQAAAALLRRRQGGGSSDSSTSQHRQPLPSLIKPGSRFVRAWRGGLVVP